MQKTVALVATVVAVVLLAGCRTPRQEPVSEPDGPPMTADQEPSAQASVEVELPRQDGELHHDVCVANTQFGIRLLQELCAAAPEGNVFVSPTSVSMALSMVYNGAAGETQTAMADVLGLSGMSLPCVNESNAALLHHLNGLSSVDLRLANSVWIRADFSKAFLQTNEDYYAAGARELDLSSPDAVDAINAWVREHTGNRIEKVIELLRPQTTMVLVNAAHFRGDWADEFDPADTHDEPFTLLDGGTKTVPMMSRFGGYPYYADDRFQAIRLPYEGSQLAMYVFLPASESSLTELVELLTPEKWTAWLGRFSWREVELKMPTVRIEYGTKLKPPLAALGMGVAFDADGADFGGMAPRQIWIDEVHHKTFLEVTEEGTEAAAATAAVDEEACEEVPEPEPLRMTIDRPFLCAIRDDEAGTLLFIGAVVDPM